MKIDKDLNRIGVLDVPPSEFQIALCGYFDIFILEPSFPRVSVTLLVLIIVAASYILMHCMLPGCTTNL